MNEQGRAAFEAWSQKILGDNPNWRGSGDCELAWQAWQASTERAAQPQPKPVALTDAMVALVDLVACEDIRIRAGWINPVEPGCEKEVLMDEWRKRARPAWAKARAVLAAQAGKETP